MSNSTEEIHPAKLVEIDICSGSREALEAKHGWIWDTNELVREFEILGFLAPILIVRRKSDGVTGRLEFQHAPGFTFPLFPTGGPHVFKPSEDDKMNPTFSPGRLVATPAALQALAESGQTPDFFLQKRLSGDWGDVDDEDRLLNDRLSSPPASPLVGAPSRIRRRPRDAHTLSHVHYAGGAIDRMEPALPEVAAA